MAAEQPKTSMRVFPCCSNSPSSEHCWIFLIFHSATSHRVLPILLPEGIRCGEGKEWKFIPCLVWTIYTSPASHRCQYWCTFLRTCHYSEAWANPSSTLHISPSPAGHIVFNFHISVSGQSLEPPNKDDIFVPEIFLQVKHDDSGFLG